MSESTAIEVARPLTPAEVSWKVAQKIANTPFVPSAFRGKPESVYAAVLYGDELGLGPMQSLNSIHVIEGKPSIAPELMRALVMKAGHRIDVKEASGTKVSLWGKRADNGSEATVTWTMDDARNAGLAGRGAWKTYPRAMLLARATSELCRMLFADIIAGLSYTPEEAASIAGVEYDMPSTTPTETQPEPEPAVIVEPEPEPAVTVQELQNIFDADIVEEAPIAEPVTDSDPNQASAKQVNMIRAIAKGVGLGNNDLKEVVSALVGRDIATLPAITKREASLIIDHLKAMES